MVLPLIDPKFGYVEDVEDVLEEYSYRNLDYRDTVVPLWKTLYKSSVQLYPYDKRGDTFSGFFQGKQNTTEDQLQINLALCASIIQMGKQLRDINNIHLELEKINKEIFFLHNEIVEIKKQINKL
jgi:hypothetical protein